MCSTRQRLRRAAARLGWGMGFFLVACTSARENSDYGATKPGVVSSDAERKAIYNRGTVSDAPSSTPRSLNDQASEINRQKQIERRGPDRPNNRPLEVRTEELSRPLPDTLERAD